MKPPIQISVKGLAKFMTAGADRQRKILKDFKFDTEGKAQAVYYGEARAIIKRFHREQRDRTYLEIEAAALAAGSKSASVKETAARLRNNSRAIQQYAQFFGERKYLGPS
jgi:hypothetical protein